MTTKEKIIDVAKDLFKEKGYEKTGVRDIAQASGISISNLQYHFPKKVMIMAEVYNVMISEYYEKKIGKTIESMNPVVKIMALEYEFILRALSGVGSRESYISSMRIPEVCSVYAEKSTELFIEQNVCPNKSRFEILMANTVMFGGLSQVLQFYENYKSQYEMDDLVIYPFESRLKLLNIENSEEILQQMQNYMRQKGNREFLP